MVDGGELVVRRSRRVLVEQRHGALDATLAFREFAHVDALEEGREIGRRADQAWCRDRNGWNEGIE